MKNQSVKVTKVENVEEKRKNGRAKSLHKANKFTINDTNFVQE